MIRVAELSCTDLILRYMSKARKVHLASPWIDLEVARSLKSKASSVNVNEVNIILREDARNLQSIKLLNHIARIYKGPVHAKLYILEDDEEPFLSIFGSENLTQSRNLELVLVSDDIQLNRLLLSKYKSFFNYCERVR